MISKLGWGDGGRETWLRNFLLEVKRQKYPIEFDFYSLPAEENNILYGLKDGPLMGRHFQLSSVFSRIPVFFSFFIRMFFLKLFKKNKSDYVVAVGGLEEAFSVITSYFPFFYRGKKILWLRTIYTKEKGYRLNRFTQKVLLAVEIFIIKKFFDFVVANGEDTASFYRSHGIDCVVIANAVDLDVWSSVKKIPSTKLRVAFIGRLSQVKGIDAFLNAAEHVHNNDSGDGIEFHVVGGGPEECCVREFVNRGVVTYHGSLPHGDISKFIAKIDCCVALTYLKDFMGGGGVSNALIEQMASQQIIIAWNNDIFKKVLCPSTAYFVEQDDIKGLADTFICISKNRVQAERAAASAFAEAQNYSIEKHVLAFMKVINFTDKK